MVTLRLPGTVTRCSGEWPCTSAEGDSTRSISAGSSNASCAGKVTVKSLRSLDTLSSFGAVIERPSWLAASGYAGFGPMESRNLAARCAPDLVDVVEHQSQAVP